MFVLSTIDPLRKAFLKDLLYTSQTYFPQYLIYNTSRWSRFGTMVILTVYVFLIHCSIILEGLQLFEKEAGREIRRFNDYKERAAKRFHHLTNQAERNEKSVDNLSVDIKEVNQHIHNLSEEIDNKLSNESLNLRDLISGIQADLSFKFKNLTWCCNLKLTNQNQEYSLTTQKLPINQNYHTNIEIVEFGSGDYHDDIALQPEESTREAESGETGSGETIYESSGEVDKETTILPPFVDLSKFVEISEFQRENEILKEMLGVYITQNLNLTVQLQEIETRVNSIQLGKFMHNLQNSLINFTQNVITLDQWKVSSSQIVNSTLTNQDQINKLTAMVIGNSDKVADMTWKLSSHEHLSHQQFSILKMHIIRLNNSMEDMKEQINDLEKKQTKVPLTGYHFGGYRSAFGPSSGEQSDTQSDIPEDRFITLMSRLDELGLQVVFNQNRLGNIEVKLLNESLYTCRKYNMDTYQDSQLSSHDNVIKSNTQAIYLTRDYVKELDKAIQDVNSEIKIQRQRVRTIYSNLQYLRGFIPAVRLLQKEVHHFKQQLPKGRSLIP